MGQFENSLITKRYSQINRSVRNIMRSLRERVSAGPDQMMIPPRSSASGGAARAGCGKTTSIPSLSQTSRAVA